MTVYHIDIIEGDYAVLHMDKIVGALLTRYRFYIIIKKDNFRIRSGHFDSLIECVCLGQYLFKYYERFQILPHDYADPRG